MLSTIPYDPSITLGNIVDPAKIEMLEKISEKEVPISNAENKMNSLIEFRRSIDNTIQELNSMNINTDKLVEKSEKIGEEIAAAAVNYADIKFTNKTEIQELREKGIIVSGSYESPIDYNRTEIKQMPLSVDSMNMNVQYFSKDRNLENSRTTSDDIQAFISSEFNFLGREFAAQASKAAASQTNSQYSKHDIAGTLVIAVSCTHKNAALLAPCVIDVDKAINVWNAMYRDDLINPDNAAEMMKIAKNANTEKEGVMNIVSGATYGSCFVGMVHILNSTNTVTSEKITSIADSIQAQCKMKTWMSNLSGGFGISSQFANDIKNLVSVQDVTSHCTITTRGAIPSIKSNQVRMAVKEFANFDGKSSMENIAALQNATASAKDSVDESAEKARMGEQMISLQNAKVQGVLEGLNEIDDGANKILDINSLMNAFEDYIDKALSGNIGMPVNYYLKPLQKSYIAKLWVDKYFPDKFLKVVTPENG